VRIDISAGIANGIDNSATGAVVSASKDPVRSSATAGDQHGKQFLFNRVRAQALAPESTQQVAAGKLRVVSIMCHQIRLPAQL